jgi:hypothetical protein
MFKSLIIITLCCSSILFLSACQTFEGLRDDAYDVAEGNIYIAGARGRTPENLLRSPCPQVEIVDDLSSISDFSHPRNQDKDHLISRVNLKSAESTCKLSAKTAIIDLKLLFDGKLGPKGRNNASERPFFSYPFFIAVTTPTGKIMAKEIFAASITYAANEDEHTYFENLRQIIPIKSKNQASNYRVLVGFQVTSDQLVYNRAHMVPIASALAAQKQKPTPPENVKTEE